ncbi:hypothetical protein ANN_21719 [Periplaneta americana]|uniref:Reverse transcriptase n=1 Tax=Periplaneta americana TaxID=6978 RepID=A0ABQ8S6J8_PERAM|nr:hypothetical protein ANN_21719 [Periplaneta americana]
MVNGRRVRSRRRYQMIDNIKICGSYERTERKAENRKECRMEKKISLTRLKTAPNSVTPEAKGKHLREVLRKQSLQSWCQLPHKGKGVCTYEECPKANCWISSKKYLSSSEYINAIKMSCNVTAVRSVSGRTFSTTRCRHPGCSETETLGHLLGFCKTGELLRNNRHHRARTAIANLLRNRGWEVHEEIHCVSEDDSHRRVDIIVINRITQKAMVLDPTICFERDTNQALQINDDKRGKYVPCLPYLSEKYGISLFNWDVTGLLFGARGCLPKFTCNILKSFQILFYEVQKIVMEILKASVQILHYHLYVNT